MCVRGRERAHVTGVRRRAKSCWEQEGGWAKGSGLVHVDGQATSGWVVGWLNQGWMQGGACG